MAIVIELAARGHRGSGFHTFDRDCVRIGRAYDNDLIIDEIHVSPHHAELRRDEDGIWWLHDLGSSNGIMNRRHQRQPSPLRINSGDEVSLGKAQLRFFDPGHPVEEAISLSPTETLLYKLTSPLLALAIVVCAVLLLTAIEWQQTYKPLHWKEFLPEAIGLPLLALVWASLWAGIGRVLKHDSRFVAQVIVSFAYLIATQLWLIVTAIIAFNSSSFVTLKTLFYGGSGLLFAMLLALNMHIATAIGTRQRIGYAHGIAWSLVALVVIYSEFGARERFGSPQYVNLMFPPVTRLAPSVTPDEFEADSAAVFRFPAEKK
jgi:hypothetical protein